MADFNNINKIFIISSARTGTTFFGKILGEIIPNAYSIHEPDRVRRNPDEFFRQIKRSGFFRFVILKALGISGSRNLSNKRLANKISPEKCINELMLDRKWIRKIDCRFYIESNYQLFGICEDLLALPNSKIVFIIRHPLDYIKSWMNKAGLDDFYSKKDFLEKIMLFGLSRQSPKLYGLESKGWENLRRVEKLLWFWDFSNKLFFNIQQNNKDKTRMYRFEDIFEKRDDSVIEDLLNFMTADEYRQEIKSIFIKKLGNKINTSLSRKNLWNFSDEDKELVCRQSKALMEIFKYIVV